MFFVTNVNKQFKQLNWAILVPLTRQAVTFGSRSAQVNLEFRL